MEVLALFIVVPSESHDYPVMGFCDVPVTQPGVNFGTFNCTVDGEICVKSRRKDCYYTTKPRRSDRENIPDAT